MEISSDRPDERAPQSSFLPRAQRAHAFSSNRTAALFWHDWGLRVCPFLPRSKVPSTRWQPWEQCYSGANVSRHWRAHPHHEVGALVGDDLVVLDADNPQAVERLRALEAQFGIVPMLVVSTTRGVHHYFRRESGSTFGTTKASSAVLQGGALDIKTGRTLILLPPSTGKSIVGGEVGVDHASKLSTAPSGFIDALIGPRAVHVPTRERDAYLRASVSIVAIRACLARLDPDLSYPVWFRVAGVVFNLTGGTESGFDAFDAWSRGGCKYRGPQETSGLWRYFRHDHPRAVGVTTLRRLLSERGFDWAEVCSEAEDPFRVAGGEGA